MTRVERVARAICRANVEAMMKVAQMQVATKILDSEVDRLWEQDIPAAHAAIEAMKND